MKHGGRDWTYRYRELFAACPEEKIAAVANQALMHYSVLTKAWSPEVNSEWTCRMYLATKMILNATVLVKSLEFARNAGLRPAIPYFEYYAVLSLLRGVAYTLPSESWCGGKLVSISHTKAINLGYDWIAKFDKGLSAKLKHNTYQLKANRELFSYRAPASADMNLESSHDLLQHLTLLAEVAQFNSELLEASVNKNAPEATFQVDDTHVHQIASVEIEGFVFSDYEDYHRLGYLQRKQRRPYNLALFMTEGQTEDFFGAWEGDEDNDEAFSNGSPADWQVLFDIP